MTIRLAIIDQLNQYRGDLVDTLGSAKNKDAFKTRLSQTIGALGFSDIDIIAISRSGHLDPVLNTMPNELFETYFADGLDEHDITLDCLQHTKKSIFHSDVYKHIQSSPVRTNVIEKNLRSHDLMHAYGFQDSYCFPAATTVNNNKIIFTVMQKGESAIKFRKHAMEATPKLKVISQVVGPLLNSNDLLPKTHTNTTLTQIQIDILYALSKESLTQTQTTKALGLKPRNIEVQSIAIKKQLGKRTITGCVFEAIRLGLITMDG